MIQDPAVEIVQQIPEEVMYCERCFAAGKCPEDATRAQTTIDNEHLTVLCAECLAQVGVPVPMAEEGGVDNG